MAIDYTTDLGQVRLQIPDLEEADFLFSDEQIEAFLAMSSDSVDRATARALRSIASNMTMVLKYIRDHDLTVDGPAVGKELRSMAKDLDAAADAADALENADEGLSIVAVPYDISEDSWDSLN